MCGVYHVIALLHDTRVVVWRGQGDIEELVHFQGSESQAYNIYNPENHSIQTSHWHLAAHFLTRPEPINLPLAQYVSLLVDSGSIAHLICDCLVSRR